MAYEIKASDTVRTDYPIVDFLPQMFEREEDLTVHILSAKDVLTGMEMLGDPNADYDAANIRAFLEGRISGETLAEKSSPEAQIFAINGLRLFLERDHPELAELASDQEVSRLVQNLTADKYALATIDEDISTLGPTRSIMYLKYEPPTAEVQASNITRWDADVFNFQSNGNDIAAAFVFHELGHTDNISSNNVLRSEVNSDQFMGDALRMGFTAASITQHYNFNNWDVTNTEFQHVRAIASMFNSAHTHITNGVIAMPGEAEPKGRTSDFALGLQGARDHAIDAIGMAHLGKTGFIDAINQLRPPIKFQPGALPSFAPPPPRGAVPSQVPLKDEFSTLGTHDHDHNHDDSSDIPGDIPSDVLVDSVPVNPTTSAPFSNFTFDGFSDEDKAIITRMINEPDNVMDLSENLSPEVKYSFDAIVGANALIAGLNAYESDPSLTYTVVRESYLNGDFDGNLYGKNYAYEFLNGVQAIAVAAIPEGMDPMEAFEPPVFDANGRPPEVVVAPAVPVGGAP